MRPDVAVLLYPGCIFGEIAPALELLAPHCALQVLTPDGAPHAASNGTRLLADGRYGDAVGRPLAAVIVPGGDPDSIIDPGHANALLHSAHERGALLAGICAGVLVLARSGLLAGRRATHNYTDEHTTPEVLACTDPIFAGLRFERADLVVDPPFITAQWWARVNFAAAIAQALGLLDEAGAQRWLQRDRFSYDDAPITG